MGKHTVTALIKKTLLCGLLSGVYAATIDAQLPEIELDADPATPGINSPTVSVIEGEKLLVAVVANRVKNLHSYSVKVSFDSAIVAFDGAAATLSPLTPVPGTRRISMPSSRMVLSSAASRSAIDWCIVTILRSVSPDGWTNWSAMPCMKSVPGWMLKCAVWMSTKASSIGWQNTATRLARIMKWVAKASKAAGCIPGCDSIPDLRWSVASATSSRPWSTSVMRFRIQPNKSSVAWQSCAGRLSRITNGKTQ